jgi:glycosyltransferase involved in cell wall biosynthesis
MALFIQMRLFNFYTPRLVRLRYFLGNLRKGRVRFYGHYQKELDIDYMITQLANGIVSPSISLRQMMLKEWGFPPNSIKVIPYPFSPPQVLLEIPILTEMPKIVTFVGKLNVHKGLVNLIKAIPMVIKKHPDVQFKLIGNDGHFGAKKILMSTYIQQNLSRYKKNFRIYGGITYKEVLQHLSGTAVCVFPSIWENFPLVCLEAMSAGRAVVGSKEGGMNEMLAQGAGTIIDPHNISQIAKAICEFLENPKLMVEAGQIARKKVLEVYNSNRIGSMMEAHYEETIENTNKK